MTAPRLILIGGGARSGKSRFAPGRARALGRRPLRPGPVEVVAT